jgi:hypothetical protein
MSGKCWRYAIISVLLFDLCLFAVRAAMFDQGQHTAPWAQSLTLQKTYLPEVSFDPCSSGTQTAEKLTVTTVFLLTAMTLL